jgi:hypothetical protein
MRMRRRSRQCSGQSLVETALLMFTLLWVLLNAINFAFYFLTTLDITSASRTSAIYSIMGGATPAAMPLPTVGTPSSSCPPSTSNTTTAATVDDLVYQDLCGAQESPSSSNTGINVCSSRVGISGTGATTATSCSKTGIGSGYPTTAAADPEAPAFLLGRVDVAYKFSPPIPFTVFNVGLLASNNCSSSGGSMSCTFYRHIVMREMQ